MTVKYLKIIGYRLVMFNVVYEALRTVVIVLLKRLSIRLTLPKCLDTRLAIIQM